MKDQITILVGLLEPAFSNGPEVRDHRCPIGPLVALSHFAVPIPELRRSMEWNAGASGLGPPVNRDLPGNHDLISTSRMMNGR
jgi:hypothetical protein